MGAQASGGRLRSEEQDRLQYFIGELGPVSLGSLGAVKELNVDCHNRDVL